MKKIIKVNEVIKKMADDSQYIDYFGEMISSRWNETGTDELMDRVIDYFEEKNDRELYGKLSLIKQKNDLLHGYLERTIENGERLERKFKENDQTRFLLENDSILMTAYIYKGEFIKAARCSAEALERAEAEDYHHVHIKILLNTAACYLCVREFEGAEKILEEVAHMSFFFTEENKMTMAMALSVLYLRKKQIEKAFEQCQKAYQLAEKTGESTGERFILSSVLCLRGRIQIERGLWTQAEKDIKQAIELSSKYGYQPAYVCGLIIYGYYDYRLGNDEAAKERLMEAVKEAESIGSQHLRSLSLAILADLYEKMECWKQALETKKEKELFYEQFFTDKARLWIRQVETKNMEVQLERYKELYSQMEQIARLGASFTCSLSTENLQNVIFKEVTKLLAMDFMGIAYIENGQIDYKLFDRESRWTNNEDNELVRYTRHMAEYCIESQQGMMINDGNFEKYTLRTIKDSATGAKLQSLIVSPLKVEEHVIGAVAIGSYQANSYSENDLSSVRIIASYLAIALKNSSLYSEVCYLAGHDALTGLLSRGNVLKNGEALFKANRKQNKRTAVIMFDADNFKQINDRYGHQFGDIVLRKIGEIMSKNIRRQDYVGRYGGEEFIAVLDAVSHEEAEKIADRIKRELENWNFESKNDKVVKVTLSGGVYICNEYTLNFADAIRFADHALYRAKLLGRNRIISYSLTNQE